MTSSVDFQYSLSFPLPFPFLSLFFLVPYSRFLFLHLAYSTSPFPSVVVCCQWWSMSALAESREYCWLFLSQSHLGEFWPWSFASWHLIQNRFPHPISYINSPVCCWSGDRVGGRSYWLAVSRACSAITPCEIAAGHCQLVYDTSSFPYLISYIDSSI